MTVRGLDMYNIVDQYLNQNPSIDRSAFLSYAHRIDLEKLSNAQADATAGNVSVSI